MKTDALALSVVSVIISVAVVCAAAPALGPQEQEKPPAIPQEAAAGALAPAETLTGSIMMVDAAKKLLIVKSAAGVTYKFVLTASTRILAGKERLKAADLSGRTDKKVAVRFIPTRRGNIARSVEITE